MTEGKLEATGAREEESRAERAAKLARKVAIEFAGADLQICVRVLGSLPRDTFQRQATFDLRHRKEVGNDGRLDFTAEKAAEDASFPWQFDLPLKGHARVPPSSVMGQNEKAIWDLARANAEQNPSSH